MDDNELEKYVMKEAEKELDKVSGEIEKVLKNKVKKNTYDDYEPLSYNRTLQLRDKIKTSKSDKEAIVSWQGQEYINNQGEDVSSDVPKWINDGFKHKRWVGKEDKYHLRKPSNFIEETIEEINKRYDEVCERVDW